ncbi:hypothetical protein N7522_002673 [Penicillium canescens]|nr:hypothetical protein N7522_002673 [Penicillium canescens]
MISNSNNIYNKYRSNSSSSSTNRAMTPTRERTTSRRSTNNNPIRAIEVPQEQPVMVSYYSNYTCKLPDPGLIWRGLTGASWSRLRGDFA